MTEPKKMMTLGEMVAAGKTWTISAEQTQTAGDAIFKGITEAGQVFDEACKAADKAAQS